MSAFSELAARFPLRLMELSLEECFAEQRPVFVIDDWDELREATCWFCQGKPLYVFIGYDNDGDHYEYPLPNQERWHTCGDPICREMFGFYHTCEDADKHRAAFKRFYGKALVDIWVETRTDVVLAHRLALEAYMKGRHGTEADISRVA